MVVLAVTWVAKSGRENEVTELLSKLTSESRQEPGCVTYQVHRHRTEPRTCGNAKQTRFHQRIAQQPLHRCTREP